MPVVNRFADLAPAIAEWRRDLHTHPELDFDTHRTAALVAEKLAAFGCDVVATGIGRTGVVGVIRGRNGGAGKVIGLRADMDALPMTDAGFGRIAPHVHDDRARVFCIEIVEVIRHRQRCQVVAQRDLSALPVQRFPQGLQRQARIQLVGGHGIGTFVLCAGHCRRCDQNQHHR
jgi:hypothetical protein